MIRVPRRELQRAGPSRKSTPVLQFRPRQITRYQTAAERVSEIPMTLEANPTPDRPMGQFPRGRDSLQEIAKALTDPTYAAEKKAEAIPRIDAGGDVFDEADMKSKIKTIENLPGYSTDEALKSQVTDLKKELAIRDVATSKKAMGLKPGEILQAESLSKKSEKAKKLEKESNEASMQKALDVANEQLAKATADAQAAADAKAAKDAIDLENARNEASEVDLPNYRADAHDAGEGLIVYNSDLIGKPHKSEDIAKFMRGDPYPRATYEMKKIKTDIGPYGDLDEFATYHEDLVGQLTRVASVQSNRVKAYTTKQIGDMFKYFADRIKTEVPDEHLPIAKALFDSATTRWKKQYQMGSADVVIPVTTPPKSKVKLGPAPAIPQKPTGPPLKLPPKGYDVRKNTKPPKKFPPPTPP